MNKLQRDHLIWKSLDQIPDPEIPVISLVEMGLIREVTLAEDGHVTIKMTPTFSGCPALQVMKEQIHEKVKAIGFLDIAVEIVLAPPWTSDWISSAARKKLKEFGITPPTIHAGQVEATFVELVSCPYCDSENTSLKNAWGPTPCRMIFFCNQCSQPFEKFKAL